MKTFRFLLVLAMVFAGSIVWAEDPSPQTNTVTSSTGADGTAIESVFRQHGTDLVGGFGAGNSSGTYQVNGICEVSGEANAFGQAAGENGSGANSAWSNSKSYVDSDAFGIGGHTLVNASGSAEQANWAEVVKDTNNFADGAGYSNGSFNGDASGANSAAIMGKAEAVGRTDVSLAETANSKTGFAETTNLSFANVSGAGTTAVNGKGGIDVKNVIGGGTGDNFFAGAAASGSGLYSGTGGNYVAGSQRSIGLTEVVNGAGFVSAASHTASEAKVVNGTTCTGEICTTPTP